MTGFKDVIRNIQLLEEIKTRISDEKTEITELEVKYTQSNFDYSPSLYAPLSALSPTYTSPVTSTSTSAPIELKERKYFTIQIKGYIDE